MLSFYFSLWKILCWNLLVFHAIYHFTAVCIVAPFLLPKCELSLDTLDETEKLSNMMLQFSNHTSRHLVSNFIIPSRKGKNSCLKALVKSILQFTGAPKANFFFDRCGKLMKILTKKNNWILRGRNLKSCSEENHNLCHKLAPWGVIINSQSTNQNCVILVQLK